MTLHIVFHLLKGRGKDDTIHCVSHVINCVGKMTLYIVFHLLKGRWKDDTMYCVSLVKKALER